MFGRPVDTYLSIFRNDVLSDVACDCLCEAYLKILSYLISSKSIMQSYANGSPS